MATNPLPATVTVLHGDNRLEIGERLDAARSQIDPTSLSTSIFEQASTSIAEIASAAGSPGFFGAERLVICHNLIGPGTSGRRRRSRKTEKADDADPLTFLRNVAPGVWVVIVEEFLPQADERRLRQFASQIQVENVQVPRGRALIDWTCERARKHLAVIDGATATRLVEALFPGTWRQQSRRDDVPPDLHRLDTELAKLAIAAGENGEISGEMVSTLVANADALDIWGLSNAIADRDRSRAIKQLELALDSGQPPEMILAQLAAQFETFAIVSAAGVRPINTVATQTGLSEGRLRQATRSARNYSRADLSRALKKIRDVDFGTKQGSFEPENALAGLVSELASHRS